MPAVRSRPRRRAWCRLRSPSMTTASAAGTKWPRRAGRPRRRPRTKRSPQRWHGSTTLRTQRGWPHDAATKPGGPSRHCSARPITADRNELRISTCRDRRSASRWGWVAARPDPRGPATSSGRRGTRARGRPVERRRADGSCRPTGFLCRATKDRGGADRAARPRRFSAAWIVVPHGATSAGARASGIAARARRAPRSAGARRCRRRRATRAPPDRSRQSCLPAWERSTSARRGDKPVSGQRRLTQRL